MRCHIGATTLHHAPEQDGTSRNTTAEPSKPAPADQGPVPDGTPVDLPAPDLPALDLQPPAPDLQPAAYALHRCYPNPFNPSTRIVYDVAAPGPVKLSIYDARGREVRTRVAQSQTAGRYEQIWQGRDDAGTQVASGLYIVRLVADGVSETRKIVLTQ